MIPEGYITLPEALDIIERCIDEDDLLLLRIPSSVPAEYRKRHATACALAAKVCREWSSVGPGERPSVVDDCAIPLYVKAGGELTQVAAEHIEDIIDEGGTDWMVRGHPSLGDRPSDETYWPATAAYDGYRFLVEEAQIRSGWSPRAETPKPAGAGRPSSMPLVLKEFERRRSEGLCERSRTAEANALGAWLKRMRPDAAPASARTIAKNLPPDFQPHDDCAKK